MKITAFLAAIGLISTASALSSQTSFLTTSKTTPTGFATPKIVACTSTSWLPNPHCPAIGICPLASCVYDTFSTLTGPAHGPHCAATGTEFLPCATACSDYTCHTPTSTAVISISVPTGTTSESSVEVITITPSFPLAPYPAPTAFTTLTLPLGTSSQSGVEVTLTQSPQLGGDPTVYTQAPHICYGDGCGDLTTPSPTFPRVPRAEQEEPTHGHPHICIGGECQGFPFDTTMSVPVPESTTAIMPSAFSRLPVPRPAKRSGDEALTTTTDDVAPWAKRAVLDVETTMRTEVVRRTKGCTVVKNDDRVFEVDCPPSPPLAKATGVR